MSQEQAKTDGPVSQAMREADPAPDAAHGTPPSLGRIVHITRDGGHVWLPAIVVKVWSPEMINAQVFEDHPGAISYVTSVKHESDAVGYSLRWRWPPRV